MNQRLNFLTAVVIAAGALTASVTGCELIASVDRSKIDGDGGKGGGVGGGTGGTTTTTTTGTGGQSTGGGGATGGGGSMMCAGGAKSCTTPADCDPTANECVANTCESGCCGTTNVADGTAVATQTANDCKAIQCDGAGATKTVDDNDDLPLPIDACHIGTCTAGSTGQAPKASGTTCAFDGGTVCDATGACVQCLTDAQCSGATPVCSGSHTCVAATCTDGNKNGTETDVDCGGSCGKCGATKTCLVANDCTDGVCTGSPLTCKAATCTDGVQNGGETDADCGGSSTCGRCGTGLKCVNASDCSSKVCTGGLCQAPSCSDGEENGTETDVDCGGSCAGAPTNKKCDLNEGCDAPTDCTTNRCSGVGGLCLKSLNGEACSDAALCDSGFCADGVCCNTACNGTCEACSIAAFGSAQGTCTAFANNTDPAGECTDEGAASCGNDGMCNGARACRKYAAGIECRAAAAGGCDVAESCPGNGAACPTNAFAPNTTVCAAAACNGTNFSAAVTCSGTATCGTATPVNCATAGDVCNATSGCVDCNSAADCAPASCTGSTFTTAETCNGSHVCVAGTSSDCANNFACNGAVCGTSCSATGMAPGATSTGCAAGFYCDTVPATAICSNTLKAAAATCINNYECTSNSCVAGACAP